jgi:hypothetical protein
MHIIFGDAVKELPDTFTVLELDTFKVSPTDAPVTAYCVVEVIPLSEFPMVDAHKKIHADLVEAYHNQHWNYCEQAIEGLTGKWNGELDTFYTELLNRINTFKESGVPVGWDSMIMKY